MVKMLAPNMTFDYEASERRALAAESALAEATALLDVVRKLVREAPTVDPDGEGWSNLQVGAAADCIAELFRVLSRTPTPATARVADLQNQITALHTVNGVLRARVAELESIVGAAR
jgi:hypothetical protein